MRSIGCVMTAGCLLAGCELAPEESAAVQAGYDCPDEMCMGNSPVIEYRVFHELHELGLPNAEGFRISSFVKNGIAYTPNVAGGKLRGTSGGASISGAGLVGARLYLHHNTGADYIIQIDAVASVPYWASTGGGAPLLETYRFNWLDAVDLARAQWKNLCSRPPGNENGDTLGMQTDHVILFEGDRIDRARRTVQSGDSTWFNIGCAGNAIAKLALTGHTNAAAGDGFATTIGERQTILKMLSADYCGNGTPWTIGGQPLQWKDHRGWMSYYSAVALEARWAPSGAVCLNQPRIDANPSEETRLVFGPDPIRPLIMAACPLPMCSGTALDLFGAHLASANPF
jgi:hypothetical protein